MGSAQGNYSGQISQALNQANLPKSPLAQGFNNALSSQYGNALSGLLTTGQQNAFPGMFGGASTPGQTFNGGGFQIPQMQYQPQQGQYAPNNSTQNPNHPPSDGNPSIPGGNLGQISAQAISPQASYQLGSQGAGPVGGGGGGGTDPNSFAPNVPGYNGGYTAQFPTLAQAGNPTFQDLMNSGKLSMDQLSQYFPDINQSTPDGLKALLQTNVNGFSPNDPTGFQNAMNALPRVGAQQYDPSQNPPQYLQNNNYLNAQGQITGSNLQQQQQGAGGANFNYNPNAIGGGQSGQMNGLQGLLGMLQQSNPQMQQLNFQGPSQQPLQTLMQQLQGPGLTNYNPAAQMLGSDAVNQQYNPLSGLGIGGLSQALQQQVGNIANNPNMQQLNNPLQAANVGSVGNVQAGNMNPQQANIDQSAINPADSQYYQAVQQALGNQLTQGRADLRARFGASGGTSRGTPAAYAESQYDAQALPQMQQALGAARQQEFTNQLAQRQLGQEGNLQNASMANQYGQANVQNQLQASLANQSTGLQQRQQDIGNQQQTNQLNLQRALGASGIGTDQVNALGNLFSQNNSQQLQNYFNTIGANQSQLGLAGQLAGQAGGQNLALQQLGSQNYFNAAGQNSQNANNALSQLLGYQTNQNQAALGMNQLGQNNSQFNAGQSNNYLQQLLQQMQSANQAQIQNQQTGYQNILSLAGSLAGAGTPGGSANVSLGSNSQSWLQQLGGIL